MLFATNVCANRSTDPELSVAQLFLRAAEESLYALLMQRSSIVTTIAVLGTLPQPLFSIL